MTPLPKPFVWGAVRISVAASLLGLAFNSAHPLGVRSSRPANAAASTEGQALAAEVIEGLSNRTVALRLLSTPGSEEVKEHAALASNTGVADQSDAQAAVAEDPDRSVVLGSFTWRQTKGLLATRRIVLVDARSREAFAAGHIPGAVSLPANFSPEEIADFVQKYPKTTPIVVYCASAQCPLSRRLAARLTQQQGYVEVRDMPGGYAEWRVAESTLAGSPTQTRTSP